MACAAAAAATAAAEDWTVTEVCCKSRCVEEPDDDPTAVSPSSSSHATCGRRRIWTKIKQQYKLVEYHALPDYLRDNEYILSHYRADWPLKHTLLSIFSVHNETLNIWTHLMGFLFFLSLTMYAVLELENSPAGGGWEAVSVPLMQGLTTSLSYLMPQAAASRCGGTNNTDNCIVEAGKEAVSSMVIGQRATAATAAAGAAKWPFFVFLLGAMLCLLTSSTSHLLSCHSRRMSSVMWRLDYTGIAVMIATSFFPPIYYVFQCEPLWQAVYLCGITLLGCATVSVTIVPCLTSPKYRIFRTWLFVGMGLSGLIPGAHALVNNWHDPMCFTVLGYELAMVFFYLLGTCIYAARIPERWKPGFFDIAGHSHQIFHVMVIAGAYAHYKAALIFLDWRTNAACIAA